MKHASFSLILTLCVVLFVSVHVGAENNSAIGIYAGLSQGFGSSFEWRSSGRTSQRAAFHWTGGFYLQHPIGKTVALMLDLSLQNGSEMDRVSWYPEPSRESRKSLSVGAITMNVVFTASDTGKTSLYYLAGLGALKSIYFHSGVGLKVPFGNSGKTRLNFRATLSFNFANDREAYLPYLNAVAGIEFPLKIKPRA